MYKIYIKHYYYSNTITYYQNDGKFHPFGNYNGELSFDTKEKALEYLKTNILGGYWQKHSNGYSLAGTYVLAHGEYDRPDYQIRKVK